MQWNDEYICTVCSLGVQLPQFPRVESQAWLWRTLSLLPIWYACLPHCKLQLNTTTVSNHLVPSGTILRMRRRRSTLHFEISWSNYHYHTVKLYIKSDDKSSNAPCRTKQKENYHDRTKSNLNSMPKKALDLQHSLPMPFYPRWPGAFCVTPLWNVCTTKPLRGLRFLVLGLLILCLAYSYWGSLCLACSSLCLACSTTTVSLVLESIVIKFQNILAERCQSQERDQARR